MNFIVFKEFAEIQDIDFIDSEQIEINGKIIKAGMSFEEVAKKLEIKLSEGDYLTKRINDLYKRRFR